MAARKKKPPRRHADDLRGATRVVVDAVKGVTDVVEGMHVTIASGPPILGRPLAVPARAITRLVYGSIRGVTSVVAAGIDAVLAQLEPLLGESTPGPDRAAFVAVLNGVVGDYLAASGNPLATTMGLFHAGHPLELERDALRAALPRAGGKVLVLLHGSSMNERQWTHGGRNYGASLAHDLGFTPVYLRYNSGLHISTNGGAFAELLERLVAAWPVQVEEIVLLGHSMGGLVARSACRVGEVAGHGWRHKVTKLVCLGSPHHGAPLERGGNWVDRILGVSGYSAPLARLGKLRSAGVTDMRHGSVLDDDWSGLDRFAHGADPRTPLPLPEGVSCYAIAGTSSHAPGKKLRGDGIVPVASALGMHKSAAQNLAFPEDHRWIAYGVGHIDLLGRPEVYAKIHEWLSG